MKRLTDRQLDIMSLLWRHGSSTVREAKRNLEEDLAYTSVLTVFQTLEKNGHVRHEQEGKAHRYFPVTDRALAADHYADFLIGNDVELARAVRRKIATDPRARE